jgi:WD40 repeat protein
MVARHQVANRLRVAGWHVERGEYGAARSIVEGLGQDLVVPVSRGFAWNYLEGIGHSRVVMLPPLPETVWSVACSSDGRTVALADRARNIFLVDRVTGRLRALRGNPPHFGNPVMAFSPDGRCLASQVGGITPQDRGKYVVNLWDVATGEEVGGMPVACALTGCARFRLIRQEVPVLWAHFSLDGRTLAVIVPNTNRPDARIRLIDSARGTLLAESPWGDVWLGCSFAFIPERDALVVGGFDGRARVWDFHDERRSGILDAHGKEVWGLAFSPDGQTLVSAADDHTLKVWDVATGRERRTLKGHDSLVTAVAYSPKGALLASASFDKSIRLWDTSSWDPIDVLRGHSGKLRTVAFSPDGEWLVSAGEDLQVRLWDVTSRRPLLTPLTHHTEGIFSSAFSPDGKTLFTGAQDKTIRLWDVASGEVRAVWQAETPVYCVAPSPDGRTLATAHPDGLVMLWDIEQGRARSPMPGHTGEVYGLAFSPDGLTLVSVGRDRTIRVWDPLTAQEILTLKGHDSAVRCAAFSRDGAILATGSDDGAIRLWRAPGPPK